MAKNSAMLRKQSDTLRTYKTTLKQTQIVLSCSSFNQLAVRTEDLKNRHPKTLSKRSRALYFHSLKNNFILGEFQVTKNNFKT